MKNPNILKELVDCILKYFFMDTVRISIIYIVQFLLGEQITDDNINDSESLWDYSYIIKLYNGDRPLSSEALSKLETSVNWSSKRLILFCPTIDNTAMIQLTQDIREIYLKYFPSSDCSDLSFSIMIGTLIRSHFFGTDEIGCLFSPFPFNRKGFRTCSHYIPWPEKETELYQLFDNDHLVFLTGLPASGKRQIVKHCFQTKYEWLDIFWLTAEVTLPLRQRICNIKFRYEDLEYDEILDCLRDKTSASLLIIDLPIIEDDDYLFINEYFKNADLNILIITNTLDIPDCYQSINIDNRPIDYLKSIYNSINPANTFTDNEFERLCKIVSYNPFVISLLAKTISLEPISLDKLLNSSSWYLDSKNLPKIHSLYHCNGKKTSFRITPLVERILDYYDDAFLKNAGSKLSIFAKNEISISFLEKDISNSDIQNALNLGLLQYMAPDKSVVQMPSIIADIIWLKYPIDYKDYRERIFQFLHEISIGQTRDLSYDILYGRVLTMIYRFHFQITRMKSRIDKTARTNFIEWNHLLCEFICYFIKLGNIRTAKNILSHLYIYENKTGIKSDLVPSLQLWEREIFKLHIEFVKNDYPIATLDKTTHFLQNLLETANRPGSAKNIDIYLSLINRTYSFITDIIDTLLLKQLMIASGEVPENLQNYIFNTTNILNSFLTNYPWTGDNIYCYYQILYHYQITYYYHTKNNIDPNYIFKKIEETPLRFKAKLWMLYYKTLKELELLRFGCSGPNTEYLDSIILEYQLLFREFNHSVTSFNTSVLFYFYTIMIDWLLPPSHFYTHKLICSGIKEAYHSITAQSLLSEEDKEQLLTMLKYSERYSQSKQYHYYSKIILPILKRI